MSALSTGGTVEVLIDTHHLHRTAQHLELPQVAVQDILQELNSRLSTVSLKEHFLTVNFNIDAPQVECTLLGHITLEGTLVVVSVPAKPTATSKMVRTYN